MPNFYTTHKYKIDRILLFLGLIVLVYVFFTYLFSLLSPFVFGFLCSLVLEPPVRALIKRFRINRGAAAAVCLLALIITLAVLSGTIVNKIIYEAGLFVHTFPYYVNEMSNFVNEIAKKMESFSNGSSERLWLMIEKANFFGMLASALGNGVKNGSWNIMTNIPGFFLNLLLSFISAFFFIRDRQKIFALAKAKTPAWLAPHFSNIKKGLTFAILGYFKAEAIIFGIVSCILIAGLLIVGYPYALFVGLLIALVDALPAFGSGVILWPWAAYCFITGSLSVGVELIIINLVVVITRHSIEPRIVGGQIGVHPLLTLMAMFTGFKLFGLAGMILGPAAAISVKVIIESQKTVEKE